MATNNNNNNIPIGSILVQQGQINLGQFTGLALGPNLLAARQGMNLALDAITPIGFVPDSRILFAGGGLVGGGDLSANRTFTVGTNPDGSIVVNPDDIQIGVLATDAQHGLRGGGGLHSLVTGLSAGFMSPGMLGELTSLALSAITAGAGLTGGGLVDSNPVLDVGANADGSIVVNANDVQVGVLATDAQHGARGGGTQHAAATILIAGFMSPADKIKLDGLTPGAAVASVSGVAPIASSGGTTPAISIAAATGASAGSMSAANFTKLAGIQSEAHRAWLAWGNSNVATTTTTRFLTPWYTDAAAPTVAIQYRAPSAGTLKNMRVRQNVAGAGPLIVYTVRINGAATLLSVSLAAPVADGSDLVDTVAVAAGDLIDVIVTKAVALVTSPSNIVVMVELAA